MPLSDTDRAHLRETIDIPQIELAIVVGAIAHGTDSTAVHCSVRGELSRADMRCLLGALLQAVADREQSDPRRLASDAIATLAFRRESISRPRSH